MSVRREELPVLDSLRAIASLMVLTTHVAFQAGSYTQHGIVGSLLSRLDLGVAIFFVLSGFLLSQAWWVRAATGQPPPETGSYARKRLSRVYPVYAVSVVLALLLVPRNDPSDPWVWLRALTLTDIYTPNALPQGLTQMWSLAVEVAFYALLPLLMRLLLAPRGPLRLARVVTGLVALTLLSCWWNLAANDLLAERTDVLPLLWLPAHLTWFLVGIALAFAVVRIQQGSGSRGLRALSALGASPGVCWAMAAGVMLVAATPLGGPTLLLVATPSESLTKHLAYALAAGLVVLTGVLGVPGSRYARAMSHRLPRHLGHISYSVFCLHLIVLELVTWALGYELFTGDFALLWVLTAAGTLVLAELAYRYVELPGMRWGGTGRRAARSGRSSSATSTATTA